MYIEEITYQNRRDFKAIFKCEHCGKSKVAWGMMIIIFITT